MNMVTKLSRKTKETAIEIEIELDGGTGNVTTPVPFLTHMLETFAKHGRFGLKVAAESKDKDEHHVTEDVAIALGQAFRKAVEGRPVQRFGHELIPMDDALVGAYVDVGGRGYYEGTLPKPIYEHFLRSLALEWGITLHVGVWRGRDEHHVTEAAFKALARALRQALAPAAATPTTKGEVDTRGG